MQIPVYGLSGLGDIGNFTKHGRREPGRAFNRFINNIKDQKIINKVIENERRALNAISGLYEISEKRIEEGTATAEDVATLRKMQVLLTLENTNYQAFCDAVFVIPFVVDIDPVSGAWIFDNLQVAQAAAELEAGLEPQGLNGLFGRVWNGLKKFAKKTYDYVLKPVGKFIYNTIAVPIQATIDLTEASVKYLAAGVTWIAGNRKTANKLFKSANSKVVSSVKNPVEKLIIEPTETFVIEPTKKIVTETIEIGKKLFKVIFIYLNPLTIIIRNALRGLLALNIFGMATKLNVGMLTEQQAAAAGYNKSAWEDGVKAWKNLKKLFSNMGGSVSKLEKSIKHGSKLDVPELDTDTQLKVYAEDEANETSLGFDPVSVGATVALCSSILTVIWDWVKKIKTAIEEKKEKEQYEKDKEIYAYDPNTGNFLVDENYNRIKKEDLAKMNAAANAAAEAMLQQEIKQDEEKKEKQEKNKNIALVVGMASAGALVLYMLSNNKKKRR